EVSVEYDRDGPRLDAGAWRGPVRIDSSQGAALRIRLADHLICADVIRDGEALHVFGASGHRVFTLADPLATSAEAEQDEDRLCAPMPGKIIAVHASSGEQVRRGQLLLVMEAMKMEHSILAPHDGAVEEMRYRVGDQVEEGATLVSLRPLGDSAGPVSPAAEAQSGGEGAR
ncbi:MAG: hypothetical protein JO312_14470, partial [Hyphomicrobiales bacterium]|nr:hypothetical protein [Hyphomicrobiales bacterium]